MSSINIKNAYVKEGFFSELQMIGHQGLLLDDMMQYNDVAFGLKNINMLSMTEEMFPKDPLAALTQCAFDDVCMVIIGGMPEKALYSEWTGSAFSYNVPDYRTRLHDKMILDLLGPSKFYNNKIDSTSERLQSSGVLMLNLTLSVCHKNPFICKDFWEPVIFRVLHHISTESPDVPIIFTNNTAEQAFKLAVIGSRYKFTLGIYDSLAASNPINVFQQVQDIINGKRVSASKLNIMNLISK